jgi:hypothetical protein
MLTINIFLVTFDDKIMYFSYKQKQQKQAEKTKNKKRRL